MMEKVKTWTSEEIGDHAQGIFTVVGHLFSKSNKSVLLEPLGVISAFKDEKVSFAFGPDDEMPPIGSRIRFTYSKSTMTEETKENK